MTPVGALMRLGAATPGSTIGLLVADAAAVTIAVAGLIELEAGGVLDSGKPNPLSVLAPTLLAVAAAVVALRLLPFLARRLARWTRDSRRLATFLAVRQLLRRPAEARAVLLVAVAVSIAAFAVTTWADAGHNRSLRAMNSAGAHAVLVVRPGAGVYDLRTAVDRADPGGHSMAVAYTNADRGAAADCGRHRALRVGRGMGAGQFVGPAAIGAAPSRHRAPGAGHGDGDAAAAARRPDPASQPASAPRGDFRRARTTTRRCAPLPRSCPAPGRMTSRCPPRARVAAASLLSLRRPTRRTTPGPVSEIDAVIGASVRSDGGWRPVTSFGDSTRWRGDGKGPVAIRSAGASLSLDVRQTSGAAPWPSAVSAAIPSALPAVVASATAALNEGNQIHSVVAVGLDGQTVYVDGVIRSVTLPQVDRDGIMVDFGTALAAMANSAATTTQYQVWLSSSAPSDMAARLARQHVYVKRTIHSSTYRSVLDDSGPAFADSLFLIAALAATVLAIGATAVGRVVSVRRRGYELAALEAVGVVPRTLRRATAAEQGSVFGIGLLVGLAAGLVGSRLALPTTPVFVDTSTGPPLVLGLPWALLVVLAIGLVVVFVVVSVAIAWLVERAAIPSQLRGAQQ